MEEKKPKPYTPGMTLGPGESTLIPIEVPPEVAKAMQEGRVSFVEVPPPAKAPVHDIAETLGLIPGLRAEKFTREARCAECHQMRTGWFAWVPDGVHIGDPVEHIIEMCRINAHNGHHSAWCLGCAISLNGIASEPPPSPDKPWWKRLFGGT